jgi:hypothetical protein
MGDLGMTLKWMLSRIQLARNRVHRRTVVNLIMTLPFVYHFSDYVF